MVVFFFVASPHTGFGPYICTFPGQEIGRLGSVRDLAPASLLKGIEPPPNPLPTSRLHPWAPLLFWQSRLGEELRGTCCNNGAASLVLWKNSCGREVQARRWGCRRGTKNPCSCATLAFAERGWAVQGKHAAGCWYAVLENSHSSGSSTMLLLRNPLRGLL